MRIKDLKRASYEATINMKKNHLTVRNLGAVSVFDKATGLLAIKPAHSYYDNLKYTDMVILNLDGRIIEGKNPPGEVKTHLVLYKELKDIAAICHSYSPYATAWSQARRSIPVYGTTHATYLPCDVPIANEINVKKLGNTDYETAIGEAIIKLFSDSEIIVNGVGFGIAALNESTIVKAQSSLKPLEIPMVLTVDNGPFTWGISAGEAVNNAQVLEEIAHLAYLTEQINSKAVRINDNLHKTLYKKELTNN
ncbi:MAG: class II aldolase/adducin family protein [Spirochaetaceae bacterium]|nr:class II aldolase/adducin family protein [Spirochaetaceae bacterium]